MEQTTEEIRETAQEAVPQTENNQTMEPFAGENAEDENGKKRRIHPFVAGVLAGVFSCAVLALLTVAGIWIVRMASAGSAESPQSADGSESIVNETTLQKMQTLESIIENYYYDYKDEPISDSDLEEGIYSGMLEALNDQYSEYYTAEELTTVMNSNQGLSYGIGAYISLDTERERAVIAGVMDGSPAQEAGLREGDVIYAVDGEDTKGLDTSAVVAMVKGEEGTTVHLTIYREGEEDNLEIDITRSKQIETNTVQYGMMIDENNIGYLRISEFDKVTLDQFNEAMAELRANDMEGLILDLRSNTGGDLSTVVDIARRLLPEGMITYTETASGERAEYTCDGEYEIDIPVVVLVNSYTASASEILTAALQDYNKATILGTTTYGKGIVQRIIDLDDGSALKLTVSGWFTPNGKNIQDAGITPDIELEYDYEAAESEGVDNQIQKATEILLEKIG